jgi:hypothetical protein
VNDSIKNLILGIVSCDYEDFETILDELRNELAAVPLDYKELAVNVVRQLVSSGSVECFRYSEGFEKLPATDFRSDQIDEYYFYISKAGRELLNNISD